MILKKEKSHSKNNQKNMSKNFYITTTLPYVNAPLHMGHALEIVRADSIARYKKLIGYDVYFNTGTDEHGIKIYNKAKENGMTAQEFVDAGFATFKEQLKSFGVTDDVHFIRTTNEMHILAAQKFWQLCNENGYIYKKNYQTKYCVGCESEKTESELGDDGFCVDHPGIPLELIDEENYFFKYSAFGDKLLEFYKQNPNFIIPDFRYHEMKEFVKSGLQDFSISRLVTKMPWGIPVPGDDDHVMYVWFDALTNYISTLGWGSDEDSNFEKYWVNGTPTQYCGKDNTRFQGIMWQAMLMAAEVPNSHQIVVNGFITADGGVRMSKTLGNGVEPRDVVNEYGVDALRYFLLREVSSFEDSPFTVDRFKDAYNANLANGIGNLTSRIMKMASTHLENTPELPENSIPQNWQDEMEKFNIQKATDIIWEHVGELDKIIQSTEPFKLVKTNKDDGVTIIKDLVMKLYSIGQMLVPIMPETSEKIKSIVKENKMPAEPLFLRKE